MSDTLPTAPAHVPPENLVDFDLWEYIASAGKDAFSRAANLHNELPDVIYTPKLGFLPGCWAPRKSEDLRRIVQDPETFSSVGLTPFSMLIGESWPLIPLEIDPPAHGDYRMLLQPLFTPKVIDQLEPEIRKLAAELTAECAKKGRCNFSNDFANKFPILVFLKMMGWPEKEASKFFGWTNTLIKSSDMAEAAAAVKSISDYLRAVIDERRANPRDDFTSFILAAKINGKPLSEDEVIGICFLVFIAGLDTVASSQSFHFMHLARHPEHQAQLRADPSLIPDAIEELLRAYSASNMRRTVTKDVEVGGVTMKKGDLVLISTELANLDPDAFDDPQTVDFNRDLKKHMAFSTGPHLCLGNHLARRELKIALEEWLKVIPEFHLANEDEIVVRASGVFGIDRLELAW